MQSSYQKAVLTKLGITPYQLKSCASYTEQVGSSKTSNDFGALSQGLQSKVPSNNVSVNKLALLKQQLHHEDKKDIAGKVLLCFSCNSDSEILVKDVLAVLGYEWKQVVYASESLEQYTGQAFTWRIASSMEISKSVLVTPEVEDLYQAKNKRALWRLLSAQDHCHG